MFNVRRKVFWWLLMKILLISFSHYPTLQNYLYLLKSNLTKNKIEVFSLGNKKISTTYDILDNSFFVECIDNASPTRSNIQLFFKQYKKICSIIDKIDPDAILFTSKHIWNFMLMSYMKKKKKRIFHVFHDPIGHTGTNVSKGVVIYNKIISKYLSGIIVHSDISLNNTIKYIKPKCRVKKVPLGEKKWLTYIKPDKLKNKLLIFGRISTYKGCEFIPVLAEELINQNLDCKIVVAGKALDDVDENLISRISKYRNIEFRNEFIPEHELDEYFYSTDASLILHKSISQSGVIIDAYRHGHPIICFDIDGISEFINKDTALVAPRFDINILVKNIKDLYNNFEKYREMSINAYNYGESIFSKDKMADMIFTFITEINGDKKK